MTESSPPAPAPGRRRGSRQTQVGLVVSDKMTKSVVVQVQRLVQDPRYGKRIRRSSRFMAHDAKDQCKMGDRVVIVEDRPRSRRKRWSVRTILSRGERD